MVAQQNGCTNKFETQPQLKILRLLTDFMTFINLAPLAISLGLTRNPNSNKKRIKAEIYLVVQKFDDDNSNDSINNRNSNKRLTWPSNICPERKAFYYRCEIYGTRK